MVIRSCVCYRVPVILSILLFLGCTSNPKYPSPKVTQSLVTALEMPKTTKTSSPTSELKTVTPSSLTVTPTVKKIVTPTQTTPRWQLTFFSNRLGQNGIYEIDISCMDAQEVCLETPQLLFDWKEEIPDGIKNWSPSGIDWSPDGKMVVISRGLRGKLVMTDWNGKNAEQITDDCDNAAFPQWSPDGKQIAFIYNAGKPGCEFLDSSQIQSYDLETGQMKPIFSDAVDPSRINWLPDGEQAYISTVSKTDYHEVISVVKPDGKILRQIPENPNDYTHLLGLDFSPDGNRLAFVGYVRSESGARTTDIYVFDLNTNNILNLTNGSGTNLDPVWSPSGEWIAFMSDRTGDWEIYLIRPDGSGLVNVTQNSASDTDPAWRRVSNP
jgi:TolB protein